MKTAVIYARYSSNSQTEQSIEGQLNVCNKFAQDNGLYVVDTYIDRAMTGTNDNRPAFQQMLSDSERGKWDIVLVYAIDRFGRNSTDIAINKYRLKKNGKILLSATQKTSDNLDGTTNLDGIILEQVYIGMAEYYSKELAQKVSRGLHESRKKGQFCGGSIPYGYYVKDKRVHIDEEKAKTVIFIYEQYALSESVPHIIVKLNEKGLLHNGTPFIPNCVYSILRNEKYTGVTKVHDTSPQRAFLLPSRQNSLTHSFLTSRTFRGINRPFRDRERAIRTTLYEHLLNAVRQRKHPKNAVCTGLFAKEKPKPNFMGSI